MRVIWGVTMFMVAWLLGSAVAQAGYHEATHTLSACKGLGGSSETCTWLHSVRSDLCTRERPCDRLLVYFAGAEMRCDNAVGRRYLWGLLRHYADHGYVAVAACLYRSVGATASRPVKQQIPRVEALVEAIRHAAIVKERWDGERLLWSGHSIGATVPVAAMARTELDEHETWKGRGVTGACFYDGVYDVPALARFYAQNNCPLMERALCRRYFGHPRCSRPFPLSDTVRHDTVTDVAPEEFAIARWKLIECGSSLRRRCGVLGDLVPREPITALCENLNQSPTHSCVEDPMPWSTHLACPYVDGGPDRCRVWFDAL